MNWKIKLCGVRGTVPVTGRKYSEYGGDTMCVALETGSRTIIFDAGTGIRSVEPESDDIAVIIGHPHIDHMLGLGSWNALSDTTKSFSFYMKAQGDWCCEKTIDELFKPPFWPVPIGSLPAETRFFDLDKELKLDGLNIKFTNGIHPGGVTHSRISDGEKSVVYMVDCELTETSEQRLIEFAKDCDLLIIDGHFVDSDMPGKKGWGHNTWRTAAGFGKKCGAKQTLCVHFNPTFDDDKMKAIETEMRAEFPAARPAKQAEVIIL